MQTESEQVRSVIKEFRHYMQLAERAMEQVPDDALFWRAGTDTNSIAILVGHLAGNMRSRWTDFLTEDGEKEWRQRDKEFEPVITSRQELITYWTAGWHALFTALEGLADDQLSDIVYIRNQGHTVREAIDRQLAHYAYHIGQIVFICKMMNREDWKSLTIPKGGSEAFNVKTFGDGPHRRHYTDTADDN